MPFNAQIENRINRAVSKWKHTDSKKMFGGVCHLLDGKMFCGVYKNYLIIRVGEKGASEALKSRFARPFDITGRPLKGWVMVSQKGIESDEELKTLLEKARDFVKTLK